MPYFHIDVDVIGATGGQTWQIEAETKKEAIEKMKTGDGEIIDEEIEPKLGKVYYDEAREAEREEPL